MTSVTYPTEYGGDGKTYTDDADPDTGMANGGHRTRLLPAMAGTIDMAAYAKSQADAASSSASSAANDAAAAEQAKNEVHVDQDTIQAAVTTTTEKASLASAYADTATNMADAVAQATATYTGVGSGLGATSDGDYFRVIAAPEARRIDVYRNDSGSATLIAEYYTRAGVDARMRDQVRLSRSLQRQGDLGQSLHADFLLQAYGWTDSPMDGVQHALSDSEVITVLRASPKWVWDAKGKLVEVPVDTLAYEYDPVTGAPLGVLNEPHSTNEIAECNRWDANPGAMLFPGDGDPFPGGIGMPQRVVPDATTGRHFVRQNNPIDNEGQEVTYAFFFKPQGYSLFDVRVNGYGGDVGASIDGTTGEVTWTASSTVEIKVLPLPDGFYRVEITGVATSDGSWVHIFLKDNDGNLDFAGDETSGMDLYWGQFEVRGSATSPIWTEGASAAREADAVHVYADGWENRRQCSVFVDAAMKGGGADDDNIVTLGAGSQDERMVISKRGQVYVASPDGNSFAGHSFSPRLYPETTTYALAYEEQGRFVMAINRGEDTRNIGIMSDKRLTINRLTLGTQHTGWSGVLNGYLRRLRYYPYYMPLDELEALQ
ncbi:phage head spike fiber domain-containing protein [Halomonas elongata]|uniref:SIMPL domain-containing protein n=1 Tax=Halomonas elongata (strain ATCC 33173 / DSM 2581 / NBRC 15536 / NCIMB 2198 / 1H9) TaxID=768066 RepID=E1VAV4_HALED|nr:SIMPL domain-containing protein [Halomonas elongata]WBF17807.1 SIMPL domain-containing protein [Halomonas elongata]WPU46652.1 SIMPL domain-containing protein [Halomonas elongata DSM 2581]CBV44053.1 uncharacterized protein HELO_4169 [Halomonas elongata DSM 2581]